MHRLIPIILLALISSAFGQADTVSIKDFSPGMVNVQNPMNLPPGVARIAVNGDLSKKEGSYSVREGFSRVSMIAGQDQIVGIEGLPFSDGSRRLVLVTDSTGVGYGNVYATAPGSSNISLDSLTQFGTAFPVTTAPTFTVFNDVMFAMNGVTHGRYWDGKSADGRPFPLIPSGGLLVTPLNVAGPIDGEVRYAISFDVAEDDTVSNRLSFLSGPFKVENGQVRISGFPLRTQDTAYAGPDTVLIKIWRTAGDVGRLDETDSIFYTGIDIKIDSSDWLTAFVIDSVSDDSIRSTGESQLIIQRNNSEIDGSSGDRLGNNSGIEFRNTVGQASGYKISPGMIGYLGIDTISSLNGHGLWRNSAWTFGEGAPNIYGFKWAVIVVDTAGNVISDSAITFTYVEGDGSGRFGWEGITLQLPRIPDTTLALKVYRTKLTYNYSQIEIDDEVPAWYEDLADGYWWVGTFGSGDTLVDSIPWDTLITMDSSQILTVPLTRSFMHHPFTVENQMFALSGSEVLISKVDTAEFSALSFKSINKHDGLDNVTAFVDRTAIRIAKENAIFNLYQDSQGNWDKQEVTSGTGIMASESYARGVSGHYYLSQHGVQREVEGMMLERTQEQSLLSRPLVNFREMSLPTLRTGVGAAYDEKYLVSIPSLDSTYVYDELVGGWLIWDFGFLDAVLYGSGSGIPDSMFFVLPDDSSLYVMGGTTDTGQPIAVLWESALLQSGLWQVQADEVITWTASTDSTDSLVTVVLLDELNQSGVGDTVFLPSLPTARAHRVSFADHAPMLEMVVRIAGQLADTRIDRIEVFRSAADPLKVSR